MNRSMDLSRRKPRLSLITRRNLMGYVFVAPLILGLALFFIQPIFQSLVFSLSDVSMTDTGMTVRYVGLTNYINNFRLNQDAAKAITSVMRTMITRLPIILLFSSFAAILLNRAFVGRAFARAVFFLPVIISSGVLLGFESAVSELVNKGMPRELAVDGFGSVEMIRNMLLGMNLDAGIITTVTGLVDSITSVVTLSGMQILIYLAALHQVPKDLHEAAYIDGATGWEMYWKVTLPITSPFLMVNAFYTIVDSFTQKSSDASLGLNKDLMNLINNKMFAQFNVGSASALAWSHFVVVVVFIAVLFGVMSRFVVYDNV